MLLLVLATGCSQEVPRSPALPIVQAQGPVLFSNVTELAGIQFIHDSGSRGEYMMPEHIGSGAAFLDYDNDGLLDLFLVQCGGPQSGSRNQLLHQESNGRFRNVSEGSGLDLAAFGMGVAAGDVNNDGWVDLFLTEYGGVRLFLNRQQGKFEEITTRAGIDNPRWATAVSFLDYDRDGWLDVVVGNYVDYHPTERCFEPTELPDFCGPQNFQPTVTRLFRNRSAASGPGQASFEDVTVLSGLAKAQGKALGLYCADFDGDGWPDIFVSDDGLPNRLYINLHNGTFREESALRGLAYNAMGSTAGNMGVGVADVNRDGLFDLFVTHLTHEQHALWVQGPGGLFEDQTAPAGLVSLGQRGTGFGTVLTDFDLDGWPDLAVVNGAIRRGNAHPGRPWPGLSEFWFPYAQCSQLFLNSGRGGFTNVSSANPAFCAAAGIGRGLLCGDFDNDGAPDLLAICAGGPALLFRNIAPRRGHWLTVRAIDPAAGERDAIGAELKVRAGGQIWCGLVQPGYSYLVSNDPRVHFGLGVADRIESIQVLWPDGSAELFPGGNADRQVVLRKGSGGRP